MTVLTDTFTGTNGAAPNASNWTTYVSTGAIADIQSNALRLLTGANGAFNDWARLVSTIGTQATINVAVDVFPQGTAETYFRVPVRAATSAGSTIENNGYLFEVNHNGNVVISKAVSGTITALGTAAITGYNPGVTVHCVFDITGTTLTAYCWTSGGQPGTPTLQVTDSTYSAAGYTGLGVSGGSVAIGRDWRIDNYTATYGSAPASGAAPAAVATVTATGSASGGGSSSRTATAAVTAAGAVNRSGSAALTATATVTASGTVSGSGGSTLATESWTGTSGSWPGQWTLGPQGTFALAANRGSITPPVTAYQTAYASLSGMTGVTGDWNFKVNVGLPAGNPESYPALGMSSTGTTSGTGNSHTAAGYSLIFFPNSGTNNVQIFKNGVFAAQGTFAYTSGTTVNVEWSRSGNVISAWLWLSSGSKPGSPTVTFTDSTSPVSGALKALLVGGNGAAQQVVTFDDLIITDGTINYNGAASLTVVADFTAGIRGKPATRTVTATVTATGAVAVPMPVGDIGSWHQVYAQDFTTPIARGSWEANAPAIYGTSPGLGWYDGTDTFGTGQYNANKVLSATTAAGANGVLDFYLHSESAAGGAPTALDYQPYAAVVAIVGFEGVDNWAGQVYGRYSFRFKGETAADGYKVANMLWPDPGVWEEGEVDYPEGNFREDHFGIFVHASDGTDARVTPYFVDPVGVFSQWNIATIEWDPTSIRFYLNGSLVGSRAAGLNGYITTPHRLTFQTETELGYNYSPGPPETWEPVPWNTAGHYQVDWVVQYELSSATATTASRPVTAAITAAGSVTGPASAARSATATITAGGATGTTKGASLTATASRVAAGSTGSASTYLTRTGKSLYLGAQQVRVTGTNVYGSLLSTNVYTDLSNVYAALGTPGTDGRGQIIRFWAFQRGATVSGVRNWTKLDNVVATAAARGFKLIPVLVNTGANDEDPSVNAASSYWEAHGGGEFYRTPLWYQSGYNSQILSAWTVTALAWVAEIADRYKNNPTIAMWEIHNEAESAAAPDTTPGVTLLTNYATAMGGAIHAADPNHLVTFSVVGTGQNGSSGGDFATLFGSTGIDVVQIHDYSPEGTTLPGDAFNGMGLRITQADTLNKPIIVGECGTIIGSTEAPTMAARATLWQQKITTQFAAGMDGWLSWSYIEPPGGTPYDIGSGDPALAVAFANGGAVPVTPTRNYRYWRFTPTAVRGPSTSIVALSEFQLSGPDGLLTGATATATAANNSPTGEEPSKAVDNDTGTKWLNLNGIGAGLVLDYGTVVGATSYKYATGGDAQERDPTGWTLEGSLDNSAWTLLDTKTAQTITTSRGTFTSAFTLPTGAAALTLVATVTASGSVGSSSSGTASRSATATVTATGNTATSKTATVGTTATVTATGSVTAGLGSGATRSVTAAVTSAGIVTAGASTGSTRTVTAQVTAGGVAAPGAGAVGLIAGATILPTGFVARFAGATLTATATVTIPALGSGSKTASQVTTAKVTADGFSTMLPSTGLLWRHNGTTYVPRRAWRYDANEVLKPVTFNRA